MASLKNSNDWGVCMHCHGDIPPETMWGQDGENDDGYCPGFRKLCGVCGAFAERSVYDVLGIGGHNDLRDSIN